MSQRPTKAELEKHAAAKPRTKKIVGFYTEAGELRKGPSLETAKAKIAARAAKQHNRGETARVYDLRRNLILDTGCRAVS